MRWFFWAAAWIAVLFVLYLVLTGKPAYAQPDIPYPNWENRLTGYQPAKEPRWPTGGHVVASWYGPGFHGRRTASGERFNANDLTAAHRYLPFGTRLRVCGVGKRASLQNPTSMTKPQHCVTVRINDRGPFVRGRHLDLSAAAARAIGLSGVGRVTMARL